MCVYFKDNVIIFVFTLFEFCIYQNLSDNFASKGASPLLAELAETCNKVGKNTGGTNQSLSESLVAQTIILDEQNRKFQRQINSNLQSTPFSSIENSNQVLILNNAKIGR